MTDITEQNCTVVTGLIDIEREQWRGYGRNWCDYLQYFKNVLSLNSKMVIYVQPKTVEFVETERKKIDPTLTNTHIKVIEFQDLPKHPYIDKIKNVMELPSFKSGLVEPGAPEYCRPEYSVMILSKIDLINLAIDENIFKTDYFMWLDAGMCHDHFKQEHINAFFPKNNKLSQVENKIFLLCRAEPSAEDLNIQHFFKSHNNRLCAAVIVGKKEPFKTFQHMFNENLDIALQQDLIDSEQSFFTVCFLKNKDLFLLKYSTDWYALFHEFI